MKEYLLKWVMAGWISQTTLFVIFGLLTLRTYRRKGLAGMRVRDSVVNMLITIPFVWIGSFAVELILITLLHKN